MRRTDARMLLDVFTSLILISAAGLVIYKNIATSRSGGTRGTPQVPSAPISVEQAPVRGDAKSKTVLVVFSDFQCPYCGRFSRDVLPEVERRYVASGKMALVFRHFPLEIHSQAMAAATAAECAGQQGRFWDLHDSLFRISEWTDSTVEITAGELGLEPVAFRRCVAENTGGPAIESAMAQARVLGVRSTPTFFVGNRLEGGDIQVVGVMTGVQPLEAFVDFIESAMAGPSLWRQWNPFLQER